MSDLPKADRRIGERMSARAGARSAALAAVLTLSTLASFAAQAPPRKPAAAPRAKGASAPPNAQRLTPNASLPVQYNRDIRPILSANCFPCHGPDRNKRQANLRLDLREEALARGVIVPGKADLSRLVARVFASAPGLLMPPVASHKQLKPEQKGLLRRWIAEGAKYEAHWSFISPQRPGVPAVGKNGRMGEGENGRDRSGRPFSHSPTLPFDAAHWVRNPIDAFILARLQEKGLKPSPEADRRTLLRRVYLDLIGIPPTPEEVRAFLEDRSPDAYEKVADRLLASPHYGERMAVPWLDLVRYTDTVGFHGDQNQNAWAYRDYVIDAFNRDKPFDQFTIEQLAGDLLPHPTPETRAATCFNRLNMMTREGGAQPKEYLAKYAADRVRTVGMTWLGITMGCAECHDHKYDPITQRDFYSLAAFFADVKQWGVYADYGYTPNPDLRGYNNDYPFPPEIQVESRYLKERIARQREEITRVALESGSLLAMDPAARAGYDAWRTAGAAFLARHPDGWETPGPDVETTAPSAPRAAARKAKPAAKPPAQTAGSTALAPPAEQPDGSVLLTDRAPADLHVTLRPECEWVAALRVELLPAPENGGSILRPGMAAPTLTLSAAVHRAEGKTEPVTFRHAGANLAEPRYTRPSRTFPSGCPPSRSTWQPATR
jgi:hypothetical protein